MHKPPNLSYNNLYDPEESSIDRGVELRIGPALELESFHSILVVLEEPSEADHFAANHIFGKPKINDHEYKNGLVCHVLPDQLLEVADEHVESQHHCLYHEMRQKCHLVVYLLRLLYVICVSPLLHRSRISS